MKYLLDTHTFLWWITDDDRLSSRARDVIRVGENDLYFSAACAWEIAIKSSLDRILLPERADHFIPEQLRLNGFRPLTIQLSHALAVEDLPSHHRDPFDRLLVTQSQLEGMPIVTGDDQLLDYEVEIIW